MIDYRRHLTETDITSDRTFLRFSIRHSCFDRIKALLHFMLSSSRAPTVATSSPLWI